MDETAAIPTPQQPVERMRPYDAFERICLDVLELEALVSAACVAIDECAPSTTRRLFDRAQVLIGNAAEKATAAVDLIDDLKAAVNAYVSDHC